MHLGIKLLPGRVVCDGRSMPKTRLCSPMFFTDKHNEFEVVAAKIGIYGRAIHKTRRELEQHVVSLRSQRGHTSLADVGRGPALSGWNLRVFVDLSPIAGVTQLSSQPPSAACRRCMVR